MIKGPIMLLNSKHNQKPSKTRADADALAQAKTWPNVLTCGRKASAVFMSHLGILTEGAALRNDHIC